MAVGRPPRRLSRARGARVATAESATTGVATSSAATTRGRRPAGSGIEIAAALRNTIEATAGEVAARLVAAGATGLRVGDARGLPWCLRRPR